MWLILYSTECSGAQTRYFNCVALLCESSQNEVGKKYCSLKLVNHGDFMWNCKKFKLIKKKNGRWTPVFERQCLKDMGIDLKGLSFQRCIAQALGTLIGGRENIHVIALGFWLNKISTSILKKNLQLALYSIQTAFKRPPTG